MRPRVEGPRHGRASLAVSARCGLIRSGGQSFHSGKQSFGRFKKDAVVRGAIEEGGLLLGSWARPSTAVLALDEPGRSIAIKWGYTGITAVNKAQHRCRASSLCSEVPDLEVH